MNQTDCCREEIEGQNDRDKLFNDIYNRPGLNTISYKIGRYLAFRDSFFKLIDGKTEYSALKNWTYRGSDDPAIAIMEGTSILCDILTFYQNLYANEAFLRTSKWRESIDKIVQLTGYRLSPGSAGETCFTAEVTGDNVLIPKGLPIKAQLEELPQIIDFETKDDTIAYEDFNNIAFYPCIETLDFNSSQSIFRISSILPVKINPGDRILAIFSSNEENLTSTQARIVIVEESWNIHDNLYIKIKGLLSLPDNFDTELGRISAYVMGRSFRHYGHNAPLPVEVKINENPNEGSSNPNNDSNATSSIGPIFFMWYPYFFEEEAQSLNEYGTTNNNDSSEYLRFINKDTNEHVDPPLKWYEYPLDVAVDDISPGVNLAVELTAAESQFFISKIEDVKKSTYTWNIMTNSSTVVISEELSTTMLSDIGITSFDIRKIHFHEIISDRFELRPEIDLRTQDELTKFIVIGNITKNKELENHEILISHPEIDPIITEINGVMEPDDEFLTNIDCKIITIKDGLKYLDEPHPENPITYGMPISYQDIEYTIHGNILYANQGKTENTTILGTGDVRIPFQRFNIPKSPLTYIFSESETPPETPEITIYVENRKWEHVPSLYNRKPTEEIYIVRQDDEGNSYVKFGDGLTGSRLPSGINNVSATYRTGISANGKLKEGTTVQYGGSISKLEKISLFSKVTGGSTPESGDIAKIAAPGKVLGLNRLVSLSDYESEVLAFPGVSKTQAIWDIDHKSKTPLIQLIVLPEAEGNSFFQALENKIKEYDKFHGPQRYPIKVTEGKYKNIRIEFTFSYDPYYKKDEIENEIINALGSYHIENDKKIHTNGIFNLLKRKFGQNEYKTNIIATIQNIPGVNWVKIHFIGYSTSDISEIKSQEDFIDISNSTQIQCNPDELLQLHRDHIVLMSSG